MNVKKKSQKKEENWAKRVKGSRTPASGAFWQYKEDVVVPGLYEWMFQHKFTAKDYYILKELDVDILYKNAAKRCKTPAFVIEFDTYTFVILEKTFEIKTEKLEMKGKQLKIKLKDLEKAWMDGITLEVKVKGMPYIIVSDDWFIDKYIDRKSVV